MSLVSTEEALLAFLWESSTDDADGSTLSSAVETITSGDGQLSQQVEVGMAAETLSEQGYVDRETASDDRVRLTLSDEGAGRASQIHDQLSGREITLVGTGEPREITVEAATDELDQSVVEIGATASDDGVVYRQSKQPADGLINRETEQAAWQDVLGRCQNQSSGEAVFLIGSNGIGKTTLAEELMAAADIDVVRASCGRAATEPYQPVRELLGEIGVDADPFTEAESTHDATVGATERASAYQAQQTALFNDVTELLSPSGPAPRLVFLDDLHRADAATIAYLRYLFERLPDHPIIVLMTHVPGKVSESSVSVEDLLEESTRATRLELDGLDRMETKQLIEQVVGQRGVPDEFAEAIHERTGGTPLYVESTVEALLDRDQLDPQFRWYPESPEEIELPDAVRQTVTRQIEGLDDTTRDILRWTATAGEAISASVLQAVCDQPAQQVASTIDVLAEAAIFERHEHENTLSLRSNLTREALLDEMDEGERHRRHETLGEQLAEMSETGETTQRAASIAYHYEEAAEDERAIEWYRDAATQATGVYANETAIDHYHRILDVARQAEKTEAMLSASEELADIYTTVGEYEQAERHARFIRERVSEDAIERRQRAARLAARIATERGEYDRADEEVTRGLEIDETPSKELCRLLGVAAEARRNRGRYETARVSAERQRELATELSLPTLRAEALRHLGRIEWRQGNYEKAKDHFTECREIGERLDDQAIESAAFHDLGLVAYNQDRHEAAEEHFQSAVDIRKEVGDRHGRARSSHNIGMVAHQRGNYERARELYEECRETEHELGDRHGEAMATHNLGLLERASGDYERARECYEESLSIERKLGDQQGEAVGYVEIGRLAFEQGSYAEAREQLQKGLEILLDIDNKRAAIQAVGTLGDVARHKGEYDQAREYYEQCLEFATELGATAREGRALNGHGWLAYSEGSYEQAAETFESARDRFQENGTPQQRAICLQGLAAVARKQGEYETAHEHLQDAWAMSDSLELITSTQIRYERAKLAAAEGDLATARDEIEAAAETFAEIGATHWRGRSLQFRGDIALDAASPGVATEYLEQALDAFETVGATQNTLRALRALVEASQADDQTARAREWCDRALETVAESDGYEDDEAWFRDWRAAIDADE